LILKARADAVNDDSCLARPAKAKVFPALLDRLDDIAQVHLGFYSPGRVRSRPVDQHL
jgi:hypothetical protein